MELPSSLPQLDDFAPLLNTMRDGWVSAMDLHYTRVTPDEVALTFVVGPQHRQAYGIVHGGVYSGVVETLASVGAALSALKDGKNIVGLENQTSFLRAVREGKLNAVARPLLKGRRSQVWEAQIHDEANRLVATGRVRLLCIESEANIGGAKVTIPSPLTSDS